MGCRPSRQNQSDSKLPPSFLPSLCRPPSLHWERPVDKEQHPAGGLWVRGPASLSRQQIRSPLTAHWWVGRMQLFLPGCQCHASKATVETGSAPNYCLPRAGETDVMGLLRAGSGLCCIHR